MGIWDPRSGFQEIRPSVFEVNEEVLARGVPGPSTSSAPLV
jgi:hypothetical protein